MEKTMLEQIKNEIKKPFYQTNFPNDGQRFVAWFLRNIHNRSEIETKDDITDGPNDKQIDAVYIDNDKGAIYIIQGKFYNGGIDADLIDPKLKLRTILQMALTTSKSMQFILITTKAQYI